MATRPRAPQDICERFGQAIRDRREELGLTQESLAAAADLNRGYIGDIERGARNVSIRNIEKLCKSLQISITELLVEYSVEAR